jgi:hypothetical protein
VPEEARLTPEEKTTEPASEEDARLVEVDQI